MILTLPANLPATKILSQEPFVAVFDDYVSGLEINTLKSLASEQFKQALVSGAQGGVASARRSGSNCWIKHHINPVVSGLSVRVSKLLGVPLTNAESLQMIHYGPTQEYAAHFDAWDPATERGERCMAKGGQRLVTCLLYLNDVAAGGATGFPELNIEVTARRGRLLLFYNCYSGTNMRHPGSLHGGLPVVSGEKWACNIWFRERPVQTTPGVKARLKSR
ncbi:2OG-Fe(II) oxygenase [uncultured Gilvimarinus sp.]|uniref:prolyl hydroxylase family protein n=1 Tax=uncultured Gilvimarinus sp. TaxID=1689143 RepID=UPI0030EC3FC9|tara:strand:- start:218 stop:877 length:660 start_codon:yes stop_codon:yes gene_type:complete